MASEVVRRMPVGAEVGPGGVHFRVWAPLRRQVQVVLEDGSRTSLAAEAGGYFSGLAPTARTGSRYRFLLDDDPTPYPDPASRFQPEGPHGPSQVVDPRGFAWTDAAWRGSSLRGQVIYELHVGTFTPAGTWAAAARELPELARLGVTLIELMPIADFPGRFGWGYDGVCLFAPTRLYGTPDDLRRFVDAAHAVGVGVILDVVYNHFGPDGNYLRQFSEHWFTDRYENDWGEAIDFDGPESAPVREFFIANAGYWIREFHLDGLRLDATQNIEDCSAEHVIAAVAREVRRAAGDRDTVIVAENESQHAHLARSPQAGGYGLDGLWNDDLHHSCVVALTGHNEAYYTDYLGSPQELISAMKWGYLFQGQRYAWQKQRRGTPALDLPAAAFVTFLENHDQVANSLTGARLHTRTTMGRWRALTTMILLGPGTPMLFQGQEFASSRPFLYFADHEESLALLVEQGRQKFLAQFRTAALPDAQGRIPSPHAEETFVASKLDLGERESHADFYALHRDLLALRRTDPAFAAQDRDRMHGAVLGPEAFLLRFLHPDGDRLLLVNLGRDLYLNPSPEPLLAPPAGCRWALLFASEDPRYGGEGTVHPDTEDDNWRLPAHTAMVLRPQEVER